MSEAVHSLVRPRSPASSAQRGWLGRLLSAAAAPREQASIPADTAPYLDVFGKEWSAATGEAVKPAEPGTSSR